MSILERFNKMSTKTIVNDEAKVVKDISKLAKAKQTKQKRSAKKIAPKQKASSSKNPVAKVVEEIEEIATNGAKALTGMDLPKPSGSGSLIEALEPSKEDHIVALPAAEACTWKTRFHQGVLPARTPQLKQMRARYRKLGEMTCVEATEKILTLQCDSTGIQAGQTLFELTLNPNNWPLGARLRQVAKTYTRFVYTGFRLRYSPLLGTGANGGISLSYFPDPDTRIPLSGPGTEIVAEQANQANTQEGPLYQYISIQPDLFIPLDPLFVEESTVEDLQLTSQGKLVVKSVGPVAGPSSLGSLVVDYTIQFFGPKASNALGGDSVITTALVTDSNSTGNGFVQLGEIANIPLPVPRMVGAGQVYAIYRVRLLDEAAFQDDVASKNIILAAYKWYYTIIGFSGITPQEGGRNFRLYATVRDCIADLSGICGHPGSKTHSIEISQIDPGASELLVQDTTVAQALVLRCSYNQGTFVLSQESIALRDHLLHLNRRLDEFQMHMLEGGSWLPKPSPLTEYPTLGACSRPPLNRKP